jgi:hypothetical protein
VGDYFAAICITPDAPPSPASFHLMFHRRADAGRFWKDLMVRVLEELEARQRTSAIVLAAKGECDPLAIASS